MKEQLPNPVFVVGIFRSGTSLLYALLNQHPKIALMYEGNLLDFPKSLEKLRRPRNWLERQEFYNGVLSRHRLTLGNDRQELEKVGEPGDLYRTFGRLKAALLWGEKSPFYILRLNQITARHPGCALILVWRDGAEIYESVLRAGRTNSFFARRGMLERTIYYQEQMLRQVATLQQTGVRLQHVTYDELVGSPEKVCRDLCHFLGVEFDAKMLMLAEADFSPVNAGLHHEHLRHGVIARLPHHRPSAPPAVVQKLTRYRRRWHRLNPEKIGLRPADGLEPEPSRWELARDRVAGYLFCKQDVLNRLMFEILPLSWLRGYRRLKSWFWAHRAKSLVEPTSFIGQCHHNWPTILCGYGFLALTGFLDYVTPPTVTFEPFYLVPCVFLTLIINRHWGTVAALLSAAMMSGLQMIELHMFQPGILIWNMVMRFALLQMAVVLVDRICKETVESGKAPD